VASMDGRAERPRPTPAVPQGALWGEFSPGIGRWGQRQAAGAWWGWSVMAFGVTPAGEDVVWGRIGLF